MRASRLLVPSEGASGAPHPTTRGTTIRLRGVAVSDYVDPTEYDVIPRAWKVMPHPRTGKTVVAAMLPYPVLHPEDAACSGDPAWTDDESMFSSNIRAYMQSTCERCPLMVACREYGIAHEEHGMWGGTTPPQRAKIRKQRRQVLVEPHVAHVWGFLKAYIMLNHIPEHDEEGNFRAKSATDGASSDSQVA